MKPAWRVLGAGLSMTGLMLAVFALRPVVLEQLEWRLLDWRFQLRGEQVPESPVVIVGIDAASVRALGRWPWPRSVMADLIEDLGEAGSATLDMSVDEMKAEFADTYPGRDPDDPEGDNFSFDRNADPVDYSGVNGTENNRDADQGGSTDAGMDEVSAMPSTAALQNTQKSKKPA